LPLSRERTAPDVNYPISGRSVTGVATFRALPSQSRMPLSSFHPSCPAARTCFVMTVPGHLERNIGRGRWSMVSTPSSSYGTNPPVSALACPTVTRCLLATNATIYRSIDAGQSWAKVTSFPSEAPSPTRPATPNVAYSATLLGLSCPTVTDCYAAAAATRAAGGKWRLRTSFLTSSDGGASWTTSAVGPFSYTTAGPGQGNLFPAASMACTQSGTCLLAGTDSNGRTLVLELSSAGRRVTTSGATTILSRNDTSPAGLSCLRSACWMISTTPGLLWSSADAGRTWRMRHLPPGLVLGSAPSSGVQVTSQQGSGDLACTSVLRCIAIASEESSRGPNPNVLLETTDGGKTWQRLILPRVPVKSRARRETIG
ncbi:MAG: beta propeller repeat protein, partial [Acidimicrobiales bacterium]